MKQNHSLVQEKIKESALSVLPILLIVSLLCLFVSPLSPDLLLSFLLGSVLIIVGMGIFTLGAETSMTPIGNRIGTSLTKSRNLPLILLVSLVLGFAITIAEPDLQVLAETVPHINSTVLLVTVGLGVGFFLAVCMLRIIRGIQLRWLLLLFYGIVFALAAFADSDFLSVAFDSGGVTTGPITVPFIMALGIGLSAVGKGKSDGDDNFGLIALCSIGPILSVLILGLVFPSSGSYTPLDIPDVTSTRELWMQFQNAFLDYAIEVLTALGPILAFFLIFQIFFLHLRKKQLIKILVGILYTFIGLTLFLTGVNVGFMPAGNYLGTQLAQLPYNWILVPLAMVIGYFIVKAEPAVVVLNKQVSDVTEGTISEKMMMTGLSLGMAISLGLDMVRVLTGISIFWFLIPGYVIALGLSFVVPKIFTAIAFDSGGVASGPMTATFLLPFAMGVCEAVGGDILTDAFGIVAMVAMTPLITIQLVGLAFKIKTAAQKKHQKLAEPFAEEEILDLSKED